MRGIKNREWSTQREGLPLITRGYIKKENNVKNFLLLYNKEESFLGINVLEKILINE